MSAWIPVIERLPAPMVDVLVAFRTDDGQLVADCGRQRHDRQWIFVGTEGLVIQGVEFWQPYPDLPQEATA
jgi:hypothetical protein